MQTRGCALVAPGVLRNPSLPPPQCLHPGTLEISEESSVLRVRAGAVRRVGIQRPKPSLDGVLQVVGSAATRQAEESSLVSPTSEKSLALGVFRQVPRRSRTAALAAREDTLRAGKPRGFLAPAGSTWPGAGAPA